MRPHIEEAVHYTRQPDLKSSKTQVLSVFVEICRNFGAQIHEAVLYILPMKNEHLPDRLLCARYTLLNDRLAALPVISKPGEIIRIKTKDQYDRTVYKKIFPNSPQRAHFEKLLGTAQRLKRERDQIIAEWNAHHDTPIAAAAAKIGLISRPDGILSLQNYDNWKEYSNSHPINTEYMSDGRQYRSRLELITADALKDLGLEWKYEPMIMLDAPSRYAGDDTSVEFTPDFAVAIPELGRVFLIECLGMLSEPSYANDAYDKLKIYSYNGIYPSRDLVLIPGDRNYMPSAEVIKAIISNTLNHLCTECLRISGQNK